jgi:hypothetical protein
VFVTLYRMLLKPLALHLSFARQFRERRTAGGAPDYIKSCDFLDKSCAKDKRAQGG